MGTALSFPPTQPLEELLVQLGTRVTRLAPDAQDAPRTLALDWPEVDALLPDGGLPRGVVELSAPRALGGATCVALAAVRAAQKDRRAWSAWIDPEGTLYAPGVAMAGVDLERLLVVRPPRAELGRIAVKVAAARAFDVVVVDADAIPGAKHGAESAKIPSKDGTSAAWSRRGQHQGARGERRRLRDEVLVRKLALLAEEGGATILLLTDAFAPRAVPWPVALRLELSRVPGSLSLRVAKDRRGRVALAKTRVSFASRPQLSSRFSG